MLSSACHIGDADGCHYLLEYHLASPRDRYQLGDIYEGDGAAQLLGQ